MSENPEPAAGQNPFSTRRIRPGALPYLLFGRQDLDALVERLDRCGGWGQIVGPHGSGKSTLLAALRPAIETAGRTACTIELHDARRRLPSGWKRAGSLDGPAMLIVDGYEQLSWCSRLKLKRFCRRRGVGLLVTAHADVGLPELFRTAVSLELAQALVEHLQRNHRLLVTARDVAGRFSRHGDNLRELLFDLYDLYEQRRRET